MYENSFACVGRGRKRKEARGEKKARGGREREREITGLGFINTLEDKLAS